MAQLNDLLTNISNIKNDMKQAIINKGQNVTNFASFSNAILNIQSGSAGDILLFSNISEMQSNIANEGDLALVYDINTSNLQALWQYTNSAWELAPTGLTANKEYVDSAIFWGANGVEQGTLQVNNNLTKDQIKIKAQVYSDLSELTLDDSITNLNNKFINNVNLVSIPSMSSNNITECFCTFANCYNLEFAGDINFPNCTNFREMFGRCYNLKTYPIKPDTFKNDVIYRYLYAECTNLPPINMENMTFNNISLEKTFINVDVRELHDCVFTNSILYQFARQTNISNIYNIQVDNSDMRQVFWKSDTYQDRFEGPTIVSNCTFTNIPNIWQLFVSCTNLREIHNLYIDSTNTPSLFLGCINLTTIDNLTITNKTKTIYKMFYNCNNLSPESYANIANALPYTTNLSNKYLSYANLNVNKFTNDQLRILNNKGYIDAIPSNDDPDETELG